MIKVKVTHENFNYGILDKAQIGEEVEIYSIEDIKNYPNISEDEIKACESIDDGTILGYIKEENYTDEYPLFLQIYPSTCEVIDDDQR